MAGLLPPGKVTFLDENGKPLAGGSVAFYIPGSTTPKDTCQDQGLTVLNTNPVTLDAAGSAILWGNGTYRQIVKDAAGNQIWDQNTSSYADWNGGSVTNPTTFSGNVTIGGTLSLAAAGLSCIGPISGSAATFAGPITATGGLTATTGTFSGAVSGTTATLSGALTGTTATFSGQVNGTSFNGYGPGGRNRVRNASFQINQRGLNTYTLAAGAYGPDGWKAGAGGCTVALNGGVPDNQAQVQAGTMVQVIEPYWIEGGTYTLCWTGTAQAQVNGGGFRAAPITVTGIAAGGSITIEFATGWVGTVQLEPGSVATLFERRAPTDEWLICAWYFRQMYHSNICSTATSAPGAANINFSPAMRSTPTLTTAPATETAIATISFEIVSKVGGRSLLTGDPGAGSSYAEWTGTISASAEL